MPLKDRIKRMETVLKVSDTSNLSAWWVSISDDETDLDAAYLMAVNEVVPKPAPSLWNALEERFRGDVKGWPVERVWFAVDYSEPDHEAFATPEGKDALCYLVLAYWNTFQEFQQMVGEDKEALSRLQERFISPRFWRLHDIHRQTDWKSPAWSGAAFTGWLKSEQVVETEELFQSLLKWMAGGK